jgi:phage-related protein (TIGR01555 family)
MPKKTKAAIVKVKAPAVKVAKRADNFSYQQLAALSQAFDYFQNVPARMGYQTPSLAEGTSYVMDRLSYNYWLLLTLYRNHWLARRVIDTPARDMTKHWARIESQINPEKIQQVDRVVKRTNVPLNVRRALEWAALYGGAACLMVIKGHERFLDEPLDLDDVGPDSFKGLIPFDRWIGISPIGEVSSNLDSAAGYGMPEYYSVTAEETAQSFRIHASRLLRFYGPQVPTPELQAQQYWGISKLEILFEELKKRDNASWAMLQLLFRAQILARRDPDLAGILSGVGKSQQALKEWAIRMQSQNELLSNQSMLVLGKDGEFWSTNYSFAGMAQLYAQFQMDMAGAADMPVTKLFGRTITGLGQSNDMDERNYEEKIAMDQAASLEPPFASQLYPVLFRSTVDEVPDDFDLKFPSVRVLTEEEKGDLATKQSAPVIAAYNSGAFGHKTFLKELRQIGDTTGVFTNITDEMIAKASDEVTMFGEEGPGGLGGEGGGGQGGSPGSHARPNPTRELKQEAGGAEDAEFRESEHPRDDEGKFSDKGSGSSKQWKAGGLGPRSNVLYHGTSSPPFSRFKSGLAYFTNDPKEAHAYAVNPIIGGGRGQGKSRVHTVKASNIEKAKNINAEIEHALAAGEDPDEVIAAEAEKAKAEGYRYVGFFHPGSHKEEIPVTVSMYPDEDIRLFKSLYPMSRLESSDARPLASHRTWHGLDVSIENEVGSVRSGVDAGGKPWAVTLKHDYGYLRGTKGVDGDHVDVFMGPDEKAELVYVVHTRKPPDFRAYDEDKCMLNFSTADDARAAFLANFDRPEHFGEMEVFPVGDFIDRVLLTKHNPGMLTHFADKIMDALRGLGDLIRGKQARDSMDPFAHHEGGQ